MSALIALRGQIFRIVLRRPRQHAMRRHHLQFGAAETAAEEEQYRELYPVLVQQRGLLVAQGNLLSLSRHTPGPDHARASIAAHGAIRNERRGGEDVRR